MRSRRPSPLPPTTAGWLPPPEHDGRSLGWGMWRSAPEAMGDFHSHTDLELNVLLAGRLRYFHAGAFVEAVAGEAIGLWAALPHRLVEVAPGTHGIWATIPPAWFLHDGERSALAEPLLAGRVWRDAGAGVGGRFAAWADEVAGDPLSRDIVRLELEAWVLRLARRSAADRRPRRSAFAPPDHVAAMAEFIGRHGHEDIAVADIAAAAGLNPRYANGVFRRALGISLWEYLLRLRVAHAQRRLLTADDDPLQVGFACGFGSAARFYAAFGRIVGEPPARWRRRMRGG